tara:strand:- start:210 stop:1685 length:1476 start_codon:yes stop_codon:yes gene_type:complete
MDYKIILKIYLALLCFCNATQVTFVVDMSEETVVSGDGDHPAVYVSGANINGPLGLEMTDNGDGIWELTTQLSPGEYTYKFRNGYYDYWDSPGWESDNTLIQGGCAVGTYFDRMVVVENANIVEGTFCFGVCNELCLDNSLEYVLIWNDEFDGDGAIDSEKWFHQTQLPNGNSWYNNELQHYTNRLDNTYVSDGTLKIVAKKEMYTDQGHTKEYTSARLNSKYTFTYGRVEVRAKLPEGVGTWPAIWMLGKNINEPGAYWQTQGYGTTPWPQCGEVDIMEHWGGNQNYVQSALHTPSSYGGTLNHGGQTIPNASTQFNKYSLEWTPEQMIFSVNDIVHYTYYPSIQNSETWPFDSEQYLLLNIAIESSITSSFDQGIMEIDYVRIYEPSTLSSQTQTTPLNFSLHQNYPNPFNPVTSLRYDLPEYGLVNITIYDMMGRIVKTLVNSSQTAGYKSIKWNATNDRNESVSSGLYLYSIQAGEFRQIKKMVLLK